MQIMTKFSTKTANLILTEIEDGSFKNWTIAQKALYVDDLEVSQMICLGRLSDGDTDRVIRLALSTYHQRIQKALLLVNDQPAFVPYQYKEVRYPRVEPSPIIVTDDESPNYGWIAFVVLSIFALCVMLYKES